MLVNQFLDYCILQIDTSVMLPNKMCLPDAAIDLAGERGIRCIHDRGMKIQVMRVTCQHPSRSVIQD